MAYARNQSSLTLLIILRLDHDVLEWFRHAGRGYQTRINAVLKAFVAGQQRLP